MSTADATKRKPDEPVAADNDSTKRLRTEAGAVSSGNGSEPASASSAGAAAAATPGNGASAAGSAGAVGAAGAASQPVGTAAPAGAAAPQQPASSAGAPAPAANSVTDTLNRMTEDEKSKTTIQSLCVACTCLLSYPGSAVLIRCPNCDTITPRPEEAWFAPPPAPVSDLKRQASQWNVNQVLVFIQNMGLQHLAPTFQAHGVNGAMLIELQRPEITETLNIRNEADVAGLLAVVDVLRTVPPAPAPTAGAGTAAAPK